MAGEAVSAQLAKEVITMAKLATGSLGLDPMIVSSHTINAGGAADVTIAAAIPTIPTAGLVVAAAYFWRLAGASACVLRDAAAGG
ncbi:MAG: hypothetical protein V2A76_16215, partial [Planctomycetota bacterium]